MRVLWEVFEKAKTCGPKAEAAVIVGALRAVPVQLQERLILQALLAYNLVPSDLGEREEWLQVFA